VLPGEIPIHEGQYGKHALPFVEGAGTATISYPAADRPGLILSQYAVPLRKAENLPLMAERQPSLSLSPAPGSARPSQVALPSVHDDQ
jgi:hypothetical protein